MLIIYRSAPYANTDNQAWLDLAFTAASFGTAVTFLFVEQGVLQLQPGQQADSLFRKTYTQSFTSLPFYDINSCFVSPADLARYSLTLEQARSVLPDLSPMDDAAIQQLLNQSTLSFSL